MNIKIPELALVVLIGASGSGKSTFARKHFKPTEIISSDHCRALVSDDENDQASTPDAFDVLHFLAAKRLKRGLLTVIDATNVQPEARKALLQLAKNHHVFAVAIVLDMPEKVCMERNEKRPDRNFGKHVIPQQRQQLKKSLRNLKAEGFRFITVLESPEEVGGVEGIVREKLYNNLKHEKAPFDIIGDVHGCFDELEILLTQLGYQVKRVDYHHTNLGFEVTHPENRRVIFVGDLVDRGPKVPEVLKLVMSMVSSGIGFCVQGNHDMKLQQQLSGKKVALKHGLAESVEQLSREPHDFVRQAEQFLYDLISHYVLDGGNLVVAHAGIREDMQGRGSGAVRAFCLYGETTGEIDEFGLPVRHNWAAEYRGQPTVVYGHTPVPESQWLNRTINLDTGCVFGGKLTALRYPERELVSVPAAKVYCEPIRPLHYNVYGGSGLTSQQQHDDILDIDDVIGKHTISTRMFNNVTIREENSIAALEVMSRFAINPRWLIYLPPTMSPSETSKQPDFLEYPREALGYYRGVGVEKVVCEEKHMGSRAIVIVCKDEEAAQKTFGVENEGIGVCYTRTGRNFFTDPVLEKAFLARLRDALSATGFWEKFNTGWVCLDCELMPWSAKAQSLIRDQYAAVGSAAKAALPEVVRQLELAVQRQPDVQHLLDKYAARKDMTEKYTTAYRQYCWTVNSLDDYKLAPFHIMATEGNLHTDKDHLWHIEQIRAICEGDPQLLMATSFKIVELQDEAAVDDAVAWWTELTERGGEGMVIKPLNFISKTAKGIVQPAVKCRGREYLRIIYGAEYTAQGNLERLKSRSLGTKRSLAVREFGLGIEGLERFVNKEPLRRVHECVFGVLALESEAVDPRL